MPKSSEITFKEITIFIFIILVFLLVLFIFCSEIIKNNKILSAKKNFYFVKEVIIRENNKCLDKNQKWIFDTSCKNHPEINNIENYFNEAKNLVNPYNKRIGVNGDPGSVQVDLHEGIINLSIDFDANGGIDINHTMAVN